MKRRLLIILLCCAALLILTAAAIPSGADFGDYSGGDDWGSWDDYDYDYDDDYDYDYDYGDSDSDGGDATLGDLLLTVGVLGGVMYGVTKLGGKKTPKQANGKPAADTPLLPIGAYSAYDPEFDEEAFKQKLADLWLRMQAAWEAKDIEPVRPDLSAVYFAQAQNQLDAHIRDKNTNHVGDPAVLSVTLRGFRQDGGTDVIVAELKARFVDYTTDDATGELISGDRDAVKNMRYIWELTRPVTQRAAGDGKSAGLTTVTCPNCGAEVRINESAKCEACGSLISVDAHDFVLNKVSAVAQRTVENDAD